MKQIQALLCAVLFLALFSGVAAEGIDPGNPLFVKSLKVELWIHGTGTITGPLSPGDSMTLKLLVPQSSENQVVESIIETASYNGQGLVPISHEIDKFGNRYALFAFNSLSGMKLEYDINAIISTKTYAGLSDFNVSAGFPEEMKAFLQPTEHAESNDPTIRTIAASIMASDSELESIASAAEWVNNYVEYDAGYWGKSQSARQVIDSKKGVCEEFSNLTSALLKAKGIPTRVVSGMVYSSKDWNNHAWIEAYVPGRGWIGIDSTYGEAGFLDGTHIEMGKTDDRSNASDQAYSYIGNFEVEIKDQRKVTVLSVEKFTGVSEVIPKNFTDTNLFARGFSHSLDKGQGFDLNALVRNRLGVKTILPAQLNLNEAFKAGKKNRLLVLGPFGERELSWQAIAPDANADYVYSYSIETIGSGFEGVIPVIGAQGTVFGGGSQVHVSESIPTITQEGALELKLELYNSGSEAADINMGIYGPDSEELASSRERLLPRETKEFRFAVPNILSRKFVLFKVLSRDLNYEGKINISGEAGIPEERQSQSAAVGGNEGDSRSVEKEKQKGDKAESGLGFAILEDLLVPIVVVVLLLLVLFGLVTVFRRQRR